MRITNEQHAPAARSVRAGPRPRGGRPVVEIKTIVRRWIDERLSAWPGLRAAHFVGGITSLPDEAEFPSHKDVDLHLVFREGSPMLVPRNPFLNVLEEEYEGLLIEAGVKPESEYASAEAVLANPEIAHHLTRDCVLYDDGLLSPLLPDVRAGYARRCWVETRVRHEVAGLRGAMEMMEMARGMYGPSGELNILGYSFTFIAAMLDVVSLRAPSTGSGISLRMRRFFDERDRLDLYDEYLGVLGVAGLSPQMVEESLAAGAEAFDLAVAVKRTPIPFGHKLNAHLRPYFVESCRKLLQEGHHREAAIWLSPFFLSSVDVILADGSDAEKSRFAAARDRFMALLGKSETEAREEHVRRVKALHGECIALAAVAVATNPDVID